MELLERSVKNVLKLSEADWIKFAECFVSAKLAKGEYFSLEDRIEKEIGFINTGIIRAFYRTNEGIEYNKTFFVEGDFFGAYASLVSNKPNKIYIQALTDIDFYKADYAAIKNLFNECRQIESLARLIAEQFYIEKENREIELVLLQSYERYKLFREQYPGLENRIPQYHIASYLGITPTQLSRIRAKK